MASNTPSPIVRMYLRVFNSQILMKTVWGFGAGHSRGLPQHVHMSYLSCPTVTKLNQKFYQWSCQDTEGTASGSQGIIQWNKLYTKISLFSKTHTLHLTHHAWSRCITWRRSWMLFIYSYKDHFIVIIISQCRVTNTEIKEINKRIWLNLFWSRCGHVRTWDRLSDQDLARNTCIKHGKETVQSQIQIETVHK